jgi:streptomycin 6-kinase
MEADDEIAGLRLWAGGPMVRLIAADEADGAMLIERCRPGSVLRERPEDEQDEVIAELARELWRPAQPGWPFRPLSDMLEYWSASTLESRDSWRHPALVERGLELFSELVGSARQRVLHTDLHAGNVLRAERRPWLAIDPKPFVGDPAYDATQHLFNCRDRLGRRPDRTIERVARLLGLDAARVRRWTFARATAEPQGDWNDAWRLALAYSLADEVR